MPENVIDLSANQNAQVLKPIVKFQKEFGDTTCLMHSYRLSSSDAKQCIELDSLNPRIQSQFNSISNADLDAQIIKTGQVTEAIGRYVKDDQGNILYTDNGLPKIAILDGSRRFDSCTRHNATFSIQVGEIDDVTALNIVNASVDSQQYLSSVELGLLIHSIEFTVGKKLKAKELIPYLGVMKTSSNAIISYARRACKLKHSYHNIFSIFPVLSTVGRGTVARLSKLVDWVDCNDKRKLLEKALVSPQFKYGEVGALFDPAADDFYENLTRTNAIIVEALCNAVGYGATEQSVTNNALTEHHYSVSMKTNSRPEPRANELTVITADLHENERVIVQRLLDLIPNINDDDVSLEEQFDFLFSSLEMTM